MNCHKETKPTARKPHICCECFITINAGEKYQYCTGVFEGDPYTVKTCLECAEIRKQANQDAQDDYECIPFGGLRHYLEDELRERFMDQWNKARASKLELEGAEA